MVLIVFYTCSINRMDKTKRIIMKEQLISFETAKLAYEKGFRLSTNPFGYVTQFYNHNTGTLLHYGRTGKTNLKKAYYAPTQSLLQKWLREKFNKLVLVDIGDTPYLSFEHNCSRDIFDTYEQALEEGLQAALKLIK